MAKAPQQKHDRSQEALQRKVHKKLCILALNLCDRPTAREQSRIVTDCLRVLREHN